MNRSTKTLVAECPSCSAHIHFNARPKLGDIVVCYECEENLEVVLLNPIKLEWSLLDDDESWGDADYDDYDDYDDWAESLVLRTRPGWRAGKLKIDYWLRVAVPELVSDRPEVQAAL